MRSVLYRVGVVALFVGALAMGTWVFQSGALSKLKPDAVKPAVAVGGYTFSYPSNWTEIAQASLPRDGGATAAKGQVVGGVCPSGERRQDGKVQCIPGVDVTYVLFQEGETLAEFSALEKKLDASFKKAFPTFKKIAAQEKVATDGSRFLQYEFEFTYRGQRRSEILGAFRKDDGRGAVVVAVGPSKQFQTYRDDIAKMLADVKQG